MNEPTVAIIDGDTVCYASFKSRLLTPSEVLQLEQTGTLSEEAMAQYVDESYGNFMNFIHQVLERVYADYCLIAVKDENTVNFRHVIYPNYKLERSKNTQHSNSLVPVLRRRLVEEGIAVAAKGREADDLIRIWHTQALEAGHKPVVCAEDKDLLMIPGNHFRLHKMVKGFAKSDQPEFKVVTNEEALTQYYKQMLMGDSTDCIPGLPRVGEKTALAILSSCVTEEDFQKEVVYAYMLAYAKSWKDFLLSNGKMLHLQKHAEDWFSVKGWAHPSGGYIK